MTAKKKILLVSATRGKNCKLAQELKEIIDNTTAVDTAVINLESYGLPLYMPDIEAENKTASALSAEFENADGFVFCAPEYNGGLPPILTNAFTWISVTTGSWRDGFKDKYAVIATNSAGSGQRFLVAFRSQLEYMGTLVMPKTIVVTNGQSLNRKSAERTLQNLTYLLSK
jgi:NAD(P)H-dependent FMN reductase|tara:strand:+ start:1239 stop:1751 length:513 start_codon:yes stop_codon:yes gene_type:complete